MHDVYQPYFYRSISSWRLIIISSSLTSQKHFLVLHSAAEGWLSYLRPWPARTFSCYSIRAGFTWRPGHLFTPATMHRIPSPMFPWSQTILFVYSCVVILTPHGHMCLKLKTIPGIFPPSLTPAHKTRCETTDVMLQLYPPRQPPSH